VNQHSNGNGRLKLLALAPGADRLSLASSCWRTSARGTRSWAACSGLKGSWERPTLARAVSYAGFTSAWVR